MFGLLGIAEAIALVVMGGISAPLFVRPSRRGGPVLLVRRFNVDTGLWPAVSIEGHQSGLLTRLLGFAGLDKTTTLEVTQEQITFHRAGFWREQRAAVPLSQVARAEAVLSQPLWHMTAIGVIAAILAIIAAGDRLTVQQFASGITLAGVCGVLSALQRTIALVIETSGGTEIAMTFTALGARRAVRMEDVTHAAERITELAILHQRQTKG